jgi:hypothetical protein
MRERTTHPLPQVVPAVSNNGPCPTVDLGFEAECRASDSDYLVVGVANQREIPRDEPVESYSSLQTITSGG